MRLFHGTTKSAAKFILADERGLLPGSWLTTNYEFAEHYAEVKALELDDEPFVLEVDIDPARLRPGGLQIPAAKEFMVFTPLAAGDKVKSGSIQAANSAPAPAAKRPAQRTLFDDPEDDSDDDGPAGRGE